MTKRELSEMLHEIGIPVNEGVTSDQNMNAYPRIIYWDYVWEDICASGERYDTKATYQVSFYAKKPKCRELVELRDIMRSKGLHPTIYHEYVKEDKIFHSYFALEVIEE